VLRPYPPARVDWLMLDLQPLMVASPNATFVLWLDCVGQEAVTLATAAARRGVRAFIRKTLIDPVALRAELTNPGTLAEDFVQWLGRSGAPLGASTSDLLRTCIVEAQRCRTVADLRDLSVGTVRLRTRDRCPTFGSLRRLHTVGRSLAIAVHIQREPQRPIAQLAEYYGLYDDAGLRRIISEVFGCRIAHVRQRLGYEWLAVSAIRRCGLRADSRPNRHP
jgi:hypothetical protein